MKEFSTYSINIAKRREATLMGYGYGGSYSDYSNSNGCDCSTLFKHIARGEHVKVILKGGGKIKGEFVDVRGNVVNLANVDCDDKCKKARIVTICCDDIAAVEV